MREGETPTFTHRAFPEEVASEKDPIMTLLRSLLPTLTLAAAVLAFPAIATAAEGVARSSTSLRAGPGTDYPRVAGVTRGESLEIHGCLARASWCDVSADGERGWMSGGRIDFLSSGRRTHLSGNLSRFGLSILTFGQDDYWGAHYQGRPWVGDRRWQQRGNDRPTPNRATPNRPHPMTTAPGEPDVRVDRPTTHNPAMGGRNQPPPTRTERPTPQADRPAPMPAPTPAPTPDHVRTPRVEPQVQHQAPAAARPEHQAPAAIRPDHAPASGSAQPPQLRPIPGTPE